MGNVKNMVGLKFDRLLVVKNAGMIGRSIAWECLCDCGKTKVTTGTRLRLGRVKSCGCLGMEQISSLTYKHGYARTREYNIWFKMVQRCVNPETPQWGNYGGRGIKVCDRWADFQNFLMDMGMCPNQECQIDRINNNGNYKPSNCRWTDRKTQCNNKSVNHILTVNGVSKTVTEWSRANHVHFQTILTRLRLNWSPEKAVSVKPGTSVRYENTQRV